MKSVSLLTLLIKFVVGEDFPPLDCIDAYRTLRCVWPQNCLEHQIIAEKGCPSGRICCKKYKSNIYLPLREVPKFFTQKPFNRPSPYSREIAAQPSIPTKKPITQKPIAKDPTNDDILVFPDDDYSVYNEDIKKPKIDEQIERYFVFNTNRMMTTKAIPPKPKEKDTKKIEVSDQTTVYNGKSSYYCQKYTQLAKNLTKELPHFPWPIKADEKDICPPRFQPLVVGGSRAYIRNYPHMVAVGFDKNDFIDYLCGGSLISEDFVLTAAHCTNTRWGPPIVAYFGSAELYSDNGIEAPIADVIPHPDYKPTSCYHDIALLKIGTKLTMTIKLMPACLPAPNLKNQFIGRLAIATGWGKTGFGRESSMDLLKVALEILDNDKCNEYYKSDAKTERLQHGITPTMMCAAGPESSYGDTCQGDSGGPLQLYTNRGECLMKIIGVTSFGKSCGMGTPGVYTKVSSYVHWIENIVWL